MQCSLNQMLEILQMHIFALNSKHWISSVSVDSFISNCTTVSLVALLLGTSLTSCTSMCCTCVSATQLPTHTPHLSLPLHDHKVRCFISTTWTKELPGVSSAEVFTTSLINFGFPVRLLTRQDYKILSCKCETAAAGVHILVIKKRT